MCPTCIAYQSKIEGSKIVIVPCNSLVACHNLDSFHLCGTSFSFITFSSYLPCQVLDFHAFATCLYITYVRGRMDTAYTKKRAKVRLFSQLCKYFYKKMKFFFFLQPNRGKKRWLIALLLHSKILLINCCFV